MKGTVIVVSSIHWHFTWQRHQNLAAGLAELGYHVTFVEPLPKRWPSPREFKRVLGRFGGGSGSGLCRQHIAKGVSLVTPQTLPDAGRWAQWANRTLLLPRVVAAIRRQGLSSPVIVLNSLPTRTSLALQRSLDCDLSVYDCCWDWSSDPYSTGLERVEAELVHEADLVLTDSPHNTERMRKLHARVAPLAHGVDYELFAAAAGEAASRAAPARCAYFGDLGTSIDVELLRRVSGEHTLSLIGPLRSRLRGFAPDTRVHGPVPHARVPELLRESQVLLLPYRNAPDTRGILPAKVVECLATGKPTVATRLPSLEAFRELIYLCSDSGQFMRAIRDALQEDPARRAARQEYARRNTWSLRMTEVERLLQSALAAKADAAVGGQGFSRSE